MKKLIACLLLLPLPALGQMPPGGMPNMGQVFLQQMDVNKDGKVTLEEFRRPSDQQFSVMDHNKDGAVSPAEAQAFSEIMMERMMKMRQQMPR